MLRPHIDRRFYQLISRNEPVGIECLFRDKVSKRLRDINEAHKLNKNLSNSKNFKRPAAPIRGRNLFNRGGSYRGSAGATPWPRMARNCRLQAFQGLNRKKTVKVSIPFSNVDKIKKKRAGSLKFHVGQGEKSLVILWFYKP